MTKICIFDLDGTLVNTLENIAGHMNRTLESYGIPTFPVDRYRYFVGNGARNLTKQVLEASGKMTPEFYEEFFSHFIVAYEGAPYDGVAPYEGITAMLKALKEKGIVLAVCSNKPHAAAVASVEKGTGGLKVKFYDKLKALELLGKAMGLFEGAAVEQPDNGLLQAIIEATKNAD